MTGSLGGRATDIQPLRVISLGAGVQSTTMALMAAHGEIGPMPDAAIFADTGDEPAAVYEHLRWLMSPNVLPFPVHIASRGRLSERLMAGDEQARVPFHKVSLAGKKSLVQRQCTRNFKIRPIRQKTRELLGKSSSAYIAPGSVECWIGISMDEAIRMKPAGVSYIVNRWPLIEQQRTRRWCLQWMADRGYPTPGKSSCIFCPYQGNNQLRARRDGAPAEWAKMIALDRSLRTPEMVARFQGQQFIHRSCTPLDEVDLSTAVERGEPDLFNNECDGICGV